MIPPKAKEEMRQIWGANKMYVAKDVVDLAFGMRKYSIAEAFEKNSEDRNFLEKLITHFAQEFFKNKSITTMKMLEDVLVDMTKMAKNNLIVRSFTVTLNNFISNIVYLQGRGVRIKDILLGAKEALINFDDATTVYNKYRAYKTWPDIYLESGLKIINCELLETTSKNTPSQIIAIEKTFVIVGCGKGTIKIIDVQPQSKKQMSVVDYIRGARLEVGDSIS